MAKLADMTLDELYARKVTPSAEVVIMQKDDFNAISPRWCGQVCRLGCSKSPQTVLFPTKEVDVLIIQDFRALNDVRFRKNGDDTERKHKEVMKHLTDVTLGKEVSCDYIDLLKCKVQNEDQRKGGKAPTDITMLKCRPYLLAEIERRKPKVILSLSTLVSKALGLKKTNTTNRGEIHLTPSGIPVVLTLHPRILLMLRQNSSGAFWGPDFYSLIHRDLMKVRALALGELAVPNLERGIARVRPQVHVARSLAEVKVFCKEVHECGKVISFDTETTSLDPWAVNAKLLTIQFGYREASTGLIRALVIPLWHRENLAYNPDEAWKLVVPLLLDPLLQKIGHNAKFDVLYILETTGIRVQGIVMDTMLLLHSINSGVQGNYGLKRGVWDYLPESDLGGYEDLLPKLSKKLGEPEDEDAPLTISDLMH